MGRCRVVQWMNVGITRMRLCWREGLRWRDYCDHWDYWQVSHRSVHPDSRCFRSQSSWESSLVPLLSSLIAICYQTRGSPGTLCGYLDSKWSGPSCPSCFKFGQDSPSVFPVGTKQRRKLRKKRVQSILASNSFFHSPPSNVHAYSLLIFGRTFLLTVVVVLRLLLNWSECLECNGCWKWRRCCNESLGVAARVKWYLLLLLLDIVRDHWILDSSATASCCCCVVRTCLLDDYRNWRRVLGLLL